MSKSVVITTRVTAEVAEQLDRLAARLGRSRAWVVEQAIKRYAEEELEYLSFIQVGIDAADRGELISQEEMEAWFESRRHRAAAE
jgi:predicted transcriptional regulator